MTRLVTPTPITGKESRGTELGNSGIEDSSPSSWKKASSRALPGSDLCPALFNIQGTREKSVPSEFAPRSRCAELQSRKTDAPEKPPASQRVPQRVGDGAEDLSKSPSTLFSYNAKL